MRRVQVTVFRIGGNATLLLYFYTLNVITIMTTEKRKRIAIKKNQSTINPPIADSVWPHRYPVGSISKRKRLIRSEHIDTCRRPVAGSGSSVVSSMVDWENQRFFHRVFSLPGGSYYKKKKTIVPPSIFPLLRRSDWNSVAAHNFTITRTLYVKFYPCYDG